MLNHLFLQIEGTSVVSAIIVAIIICVIFFAIQRKSTLYFTRRKTPILAKRKRLTEFEKGLLYARLVTSTWHSQPNPPEVYIGDTRIHHGEVGVMLGVAGILTDDERLTGLGTGLALDDLHDAPEWFTFKKRDDFSGYV